jgi:hypothetical protein
MCVYVLTVRTRTSSIEITVVLLGFSVLDQGYGRGAPGVK